MTAAPPPFKFAVTPTISLSLTHFPALVTPNHPKFAVVAHPLGRLGGSQRDPIVGSVRRVLCKLGWEVVTFDSRGVGLSEGSASFTGQDEGTDYQEIVDKYVVPKIEEASKKMLNSEQAGKAELLLAGYSAGSLYSTYVFPTSPITSSTPLHLHISHLLISYPLGVLWALTAFHASTFQSKFKDLVSRAHDMQDTYRLMVIFGDSDEFTGIKNYNKWMEENEMLKDQESGDKSKVKVVQVKGADHFWRGESLERLEEEVEKWVVEKESSKL